MRVEGRGLRVRVGADRRRASAAARGAHRLDEGAPLLGARLLVEASEGAADLLVGRVVDGHLHVDAAGANESAVEPLLVVGCEEEDGAPRVADAIEGVEQPREGDGARGRALWHDPPVYGKTDICRMRPRRLRHGPPAYVKIVI